MAGTCGTEEGNVENQSRLDRMRRTMEVERLDALAVRLPENVLLLSGYWPMIGAGVLVFPREGRPVCAIPHCYEAEAGMSLWEAEPVYFKYGVLDAPEPDAAMRDILSHAARGKGWKRVGYEASFEVVAPPWNSGEAQVPAAQTRELYRASFDDSELVDVSALLQTERRRKTAYEIARIRIASEISRIGLEAFERLAVVGASGVELAAGVEREIMIHGTGYQGAFRVRAYAQVAVGPDESAIGYRPNEVSTRHHLESGDVALLELGVVADGYWADRTRVRVAGTPTDEQLKVFETVRRAQEVAVAAIRPGISGAEVDSAARSVIREAGYAGFFPHITGHGVGFGYHESLPKLAPGETAPLEEGMVTSVEPGIYCKPCGGFRIEDDVLVTHGGSETLGPYRNSLT
jgi:Xaa-Pro aminopeptidase